MANTSDLASGVTIKKRRLDAIRTAREEFKPALKGVFPYVSGGLLLGCFFLVVSKAADWLSTLDHLPDNWTAPLVAGVASPLATILNHIAVGFFVSSTCVLLYEWGAHFKQILAQSKALTQTLESHVSTVLEASARDALRRALAELLGKYSINLLEPIERLATAAITLHRGGNWSNEAYIDFLTHMLSSAASNAESLSEISAEQAKDIISNKDHELALSNPGELADLVLKNEISALDSAGEYIVVSDIGSWSLLPLFTFAQAAAVKRGVRIRRIFVYTEPPDHQTSRVLSQHYTFASLWSEASRADGNNGSYKIKLVKDESLKIMDRYIARLGHFGIFRTSRAADVAVRFAVTDDDLSQFTLRTIATKDGLVQKFDKVWGKLHELTVKERVEHLLRLELACLPENGSYHVVSDFDSWRDDHLKQFHDDTLDAIRDRNITVRRIFVYSKPADGKDDAKAECGKILRKHLADMQELAAAERFPYHVKVCHLDQAQAILGERWHFGVFRSGGSIGDERKIVVSESTRDDMADFLLEPADTDDRAKDMDRFFDTLKPARERAVDLFQWSTHD